jgi:hypothetical protein
MSEVQTATIQTDVPVRLLAEMQTLVEAGWFRDLDELMLDALRRFVESHRAELMERFIREDVEWGLHGFYLKQAGDTAAGGRGPAGDGRPGQTSPRHGPRVPAR